ncbi:hypothetical protein M0805_007931 [Coniferiporia weirii]|nr:hypothetical protein M0805_007931 [Coniferiporia weirii]
MNSSTSDASRAELKRQIEALQAQLAEQPPTPPAKRRKTDEATVLAPATPSPRKKINERRERAQSPTDFTRRAQQTRPIPPLKGSSKSKSSLKQGSAHAIVPDAPAPSSLVAQLKSLSTNKKSDHEPVVRSEGFAQKPAAPQPPPAAEAVNAPVRDDRLAIVEELEVGPVEHTPIAGDSHFEKIEPNSGIRLKSRVLPHEALQDHLSGRYFLPPSLLYSVVRLQPNKQAYEVPVEGDWVTIAVVAERGEVRFTTGPGNSAHGKRGDGDDLTGDKDTKKAGQGSGSNARKKGDDGDDEENPRKGGKKYVHLKLIDLGLRSRSTSSAAPRSSLRGDAQLSLLLFESDYFDRLINNEDGKRKEQKIYRGGSGGAFEECFTKLREGAVVALLNPKVLKPFQNTKSPASSSILALTPPSASAIDIIGYASDLGMCTVVKRDGKPCRAWVDRRANSASGTGKGGGEDVCEYHIQHAVQRARAGRAEFSIGTSGMSTTAAKRKTAYDPARQWGLKPEGPGGGARGPDGESTYVVGGLIASSGRGRAQAPGVAGETIGREGQARARRRVAEHEDAALAALLGKGTGGGAESNGGASRGVIDVVRRAREAAARGTGAAAGKKGGDKRGGARVPDGKAKTKTKGSEKAVNADPDAGEDGVDESGSGSGSGSGAPRSEQEHAPPRRKTYSAEMVKRLGFDPVLMAYGSRPGGAGSGGKQGANAKNENTMLGKASGQKREIQLGPPPGSKVRSGVFVPPAASSLSLSNSAGGSKDNPTASKQQEDENSCMGEVIKPSGAGKDSLKSQMAVPEPKGGAKEESDSDLEIEPPMPTKAHADDSDELEYI